MKTIFKYVLAMGDLQHIPMPKGAEVLAVQTQDDLPCLWALCDKHAPYVSRTVKIVGTGWTEADIQRDQYIGTFQQGPFVWHVFDLGEALR